MIHSRTTTTADSPVRRSARLSAGDLKRYSPRPDPDEVYVASPKVRSCY